MTEWSDERRESVAAQFRRVGGDWHESNGLCDPRGPLWLECLACHRLRTIEEVADAVLGGDRAAMWRCRRCGFEADGRDVWEYQTAFLLNLTESPHCPPIVREVLTRCAFLTTMAITRTGSIGRGERRGTDQPAKLLHPPAEWGETWGRNFYEGGIYLRRA